MRDKAALYPYLSSLYSIVEHFEELQSEYSLSRLVAPASYSGIGSDAGLIINGNPLGIVVNNNLDVTSSEWNTLLVFDAFEKGGSIFLECIQYVNSALESGKAVRFITADPHHVADVFLKLAESCPGQFKIISNFIELKSVLHQEYRINLINTPIVLISGLVEEADVFSVLIKLSLYLKGANIKHLVLTKQAAGILAGFYSYQHIFEDDSLNEAGRTEFLNNYVSSLEKKHLPEVILVEAPDAALTYNRYAPNGFSIRTYMMSQALSVDACVLCAPCDLVVQKYLSEVSKGLEKRFGFRVDAVHASNLLVDSYAVQLQESISCIRPPLNYVNKYLKEANADPNGIPCYNVFDEQQIKKLGIQLFGERNARGETDHQAKKKNILSNISTTSIGEELNKLLERDFDVDSAYLTGRYNSVPLTSSPFSFSTVKMVLLFFEIERYFNFRIPEEFLDNYGFLTIEKITHIVESLI